MLRALIEGSKQLRVLEGSPSVNANAYLTFGQCPGETPAEPASMEIACLHLKLVEPVMLDGDSIHLLHDNPEICSLPRLQAQGLEFSLDTAPPHPVRLRCCILRALYIYIYIYTYLHY